VFKFLAIAGYTSLFRLAYRDVGDEREHDCMDAGDRATQDTKPRDAEALL